MRNFIHFGSRLNAVITLVAVVVAFVMLLRGCGPSDPPESYQAESSAPPRIGG